MSHRNKTPPQQSQSFPQSTPISNKLSGTHQHRSKIELRAALNRNLSREMEGHFVGPMPPREFLDKFMQTERAPKLGKKNYWANLTSKTSEQAMYVPFVSAASSFTTDLHFVNTNSSVDVRCDQLRPDVSVYDDSRNVEGAEFSKMEFFVELKSNALDDPFCDGEDAFSNPNFPFERNTDEASEIRGQLSSYAAALTGTQFRVHVFSIIICGSHARLMRWDRSGVVVTERFDYTNAGNSFLSEFILRYSQLTPSNRGHDLSVIKIPNYRNRAARRKLGEYFEELYKKPPRDFYYIKIYDSDASKDDLIDVNKGHKYVIAYPPPYTTCSPFGRATRGIIAYDEEEERPVFIKDYWRTIARGMEKEGDIYDSLQEKDVPNIAVFGGGNDFLSHETRSKQFVNEKWARACSLNFKALRHYRLLLRTVGKKLTAFESTRQLVSVIADAMEAHDKAYFNARILHRDISVGNIMIDEHGKGFLIDWDLCIRVGQTESEPPRQPQRTGTWQFMSAKLLLDPDHIQDIQDDRESAFYVLTWTALWYNRHNKVNKLKAQLDPYDEEYPDSEGIIKGGRLKRDMFSHFDVKFGSLPLDALVQALKDAFAVRYRNRPSADDYEIHQHLVRTGSGLAKVSVVAKFEEAEEQIKRRIWLVDTFRDYLKLDNWPQNDKARKNYTRVLREGTQEETERKRKANNSNSQSQASQSSSKSRKHNDGGHSSRRNG